MMKIYTALLTLFFIVSFVSLYFNDDGKVFAANDTFSADGQISSTILGMPPSANTVNMSTVEKFILSGNWKLVTDKGKIANFTSEFYTGPVNGANNHTHQLTNLRIESDKPVQLSADGSTKILGLLDVMTNGKSAWNDVPTTISISKGRTISIDIADNGTQRHFMGQPIYGIVKDLTIMNIPSNDTMLNSNMTNKSSSLNIGSNVPKI
jgi:hypothetical protein